MASAAGGFVIEANNAQPDVGIQVGGDTQISIGEGGHIVLMTEAGQMIRKDGPYEGPADGILAGQTNSNDIAMEGGLLGSLLELAEVSGKSEEQLGAVRGTTEEGAERPDAISTAVSDFCLMAGQTPVFYTSNAPAVDEPLIVRRRVRPVQFLQTTWPAGENTLAWPGDWPPAEEGRYVWALGARGTVALRVIELEEVPENALASAALHYDLGCEMQAKALFQAALAAAQ
ncbi:MAG: hypothetical protein V3U93_04930 [Alphaproteobacteria bacterium]